MNSKINWALIASIVTTIGGAVGAIVAPLYGQGLGNSVQMIATAVAGLLTAIGAFHVGSVAVATARIKATARAQLIVEHPTMTHEQKMEALA